MTTTPAFQSILFDPASYQPDDRTRNQPDFFVDLNLDQVVESITSGREEYDLAPFLYRPLRTIEAITYRHEVFRDLENHAVNECVTTFADMIRMMREQLAQAKKLYYQRQQQSWFLDAIRTYVDAVDGLNRDLGAANLRSRGLVGFRDALATYVTSKAFIALADETARLKDRLTDIRYCLHILGDRIKVSRYEKEIDYSDQVTAAFAKFQQGTVKDYRIGITTWVDMNHVEAEVLDRVALLYPDVFAGLDRCCTAHVGYLDKIVAAFDREVQFYLAYREFTTRIEAAGLDFCYPRVSKRSKHVAARDAFDIALADKLVKADVPVICNDFELRDPERVIVVSGPNQGGKTTFARTFGQLHYLARLGLLVPGSHAQLFLFDRMFTHFEREEDLHDLNGKLQDDLLRMHDILEQATPSSVIIMNEIFTSTTLEDAILLGTKILAEIIDLDLLCVCVTFVDELATLSDTTVSMLSTVVPEDPSVRTFKVERKPADGLAHAVAIAEKYGLTYSALQTRIAS